MGNGPGAAGDKIHVPYDLFPLRLRGEGCRRRAGGRRRHPPSDSLTRFYVSKETNSLDDPGDDSIGAGIIGVQPALQAHVETAVSQPSCEQQATRRISGRIRKGDGPTQVRRNIQFSATLQSVNVARRSGEDPPGRLRTTVRLRMISKHLRRSGRCRLPALGLALLFLPDEQQDHSSG